MISARAFLDVALTQNGKPYIFGVEPGTGPDPRALDCSELIQWAGARLGLNFPDGAINQYNWIKGKGLDIPVRSALRTRGALLFKHGVGRHQPIYHVGISMGDGAHIFEAKGSSYGVGKFAIGSWANSPAEKENCWNLAGLLPGLDYGSNGSIPALPWVLFALALWL